MRFVARSLGRVIMPCVWALLLSGCARQSLKNTTSIQVGPRTEPARVQGDTLAYNLSFATKTEREQFVGSFESFIANQHIASRQTDETGNTVTIRILPPSESQQVQPVTPQPVRPETLSLVRQPIQEQPESGGTLTWYSPRAFLDDNLASLVQSAPFGGSCPEAGSSSQPTGDRKWLLVPTAVTDRKITLLLADTLHSASGKVLTPFDLVVLWTSYIKEHPAEGMALFRSVRGVEAFIKGQEGVINGFAVTSPQSLTLTFDRPDPDALARLCDSRLFSPEFGFGAYLLKPVNSRTWALTPNRQSRGVKAYLDKLTVVCGGDRNPFLAYSLSKYDCVVVWSRKDVDYVKRSLYDKSQLIEYSRDRYFLSFNIADAELRAFAARVIDAHGILNATNVAEGEALGAVETDAPARGPVDSAASAAPPSASGRTLPMIVRDDDPLSVLIAERLFSDLARKGVTCELKRLDRAAYERALIARDWALAIGWVGRDALISRSERLRLAALWFDGQSDESKRLRDNAEVPLFAVKSYLLCRSQVRFAEGSIAGLYLARPAASGNQ